MNKQIWIWDIVLLAFGIAALIACFVVFKDYQKRFDAAEKAYKPIQPRGELIYTPIPK